MISWIKDNKTVSLTLVLLLAMTLGLFLRSPQSRVETKVVTQDVVVTKEVVKYVDRVVYRDRVRTITTTKPDGTKIVLQEDTKVQSKTSDRVIEGDKTDVRTQSQESISISNLNRYFVGISVSRSFSLSAPVYEISGGLRFGNLPLYATFVTVPIQKQLGLGLQLEF